MSCNHNLTKRELEVLELLSQGYSNSEIGKKLFIETSTVRDHIIHIYQKLNVTAEIYPHGMLRLLVVLKYLKDFKEKELVLREGI